MGSTDDVLHSLNPEERESKTKSGEQINKVYTNTSSAK
jgi:hypothetical protein